MGQRNDEFRRKYNELDHLCRAKYNMFRGKDGKRINLSAIRVFADSLPESEGERLRNIVKLRNIIEHTDAAEVNPKIIKELDMFLAIIKGKYSLKQNVSFDVVSYINHNVSKMNRELMDLDNEEFEISKQQMKQIESELRNYIAKLKNAKSMDAAKSIVYKFYNELDNIEDHPICKRQNMIDAKKVAIMEIKEAVNEAMNETINPFKRKKIKDIASRYIAMIESSNDEYEIEDYSEDACFAIEDVVL